MKKYLCLLMILFSALGWAAKPKWLSETGAYCGQQKLCAVGEGSGHLSAESNAMNALAKIFGTHVQSKLEIYNKSSSQTDESGPLSGVDDEEVTATIKEKTDQLLVGVEVKEKYETPDGIFALAVLNKIKGAKILKTQMQEIDEKIKGWFKDGRRASLNKILKEFKIRGNLNLKHQVLTEKSYPSPITYRQVIAKKAKKRAKKVVVFVDFKSFEKKSPLKHVFINALVDNDYLVVVKKALPHQYIVKGELTTEKTYFNVKGFEKHHFHFKIVSEKLDGKKLGALNFSSEQIGRDQRQSFNKASVEIKKYIIENLDELNID